MADQPTSVKPLWSGRLKGPGRSVLQYTESLSRDRQLALYDLRGTRAHVRMLRDQGILKTDLAARIEVGLDRIEREIRLNEFPWRQELEDVHMNIEQRLQELIGEEGKWVHTGRSRNDQVSLDMRLYCLDLARAWKDALLALASRFLERAPALTRESLPGWTHLQAAQPISWAHYLLSFVSMLSRDERRLTDYARANRISPLGAGALAGSTLPLHPEATARHLGLDEAFQNSYDVAGDRDFVLELLQVGVQIMLHLSRLASDLIYMSSTPVGWIELPDAVCTGSSMMPQKKNPDVLELLRGKTASVIAHCQGLSTLLQGLPTSYHRDLQQDKEHLLACAEHIEPSLELAAIIVEGFQIRSEVVAEDLKKGFTVATDLAEWLTARGTPFREAHGIVARLVARAVEENLELSDLPEEEVAELLGGLKPGERPPLTVLRALDRKEHAGSTGPKPVKEQLRYWRRWLRGRS